MSQRVIEANGASRLTWNCLESAALSDEKYLLEALVRCGVLPYRDGATELPSEFRLTYRKNHLEFC